MKINNKRGVLGITSLFATKGFAMNFVLANKIAWGAIVLSCIWHIPAWDKAKDIHTEAAFQAQEMWPQQLFDKLPGGGRTMSPISGSDGNGGNFKG
jgi:hypothetical protein